MGDAIIEAIKSGLGLITELANQLLSGFSALIWDAAANEGKGALTSFGTFSLVFLGIAITFSVIKLCLYLVRSHVG